MSHAPTLRLKPLSSTDLSLPTCPSTNLSNLSESSPISGCRFYHISGAEMPPYICCIIIGIGPAILPNGIRQICQMANSCLHSLQAKKSAPALFLKTHSSPDKNPISAKMHALLPPRYIPPDRTSVPPDPCIPDIFRPKHKIIDVIRRKRLRKKKVKKEGKKKEN